MVEVDLTKFHEKLAERRRKQEEAEKAAQEAAPEFSEDLVPEEIYDHSEANQALDNILEGVTVLDAYRRWCNKMTPVVRTGQTEGIMVSCPIPGHIDSNPSAWINLDKQTWFCGGCQEGGDKYDIAAYWTGFSVPGYKEGAEFHRLRERMAEDLGYQIHKISPDETIIVPPVDDKYEPEDEPVEPPSLASVSSLLGEDLSIEEDSDNVMSLDWRPVCPEGTFLHAYMKAVVKDDAPDEYHFFHGLIALGFALGREVTLWDTTPVYANLFVCTLGRTGSGKSKARKHLDVLLNKAMPYDRTFVPNHGVLRVNAPGSAESLIAQFMEPVPDPTNPKRIAYYAPVKGIIDFNELSGLVGRTNRQGSVMKPALMQFYDMDERIQSVSISSGNKMAEKPFASCLTTSQPDALRDLLTSSDASSGFLNRWIFVPGTYKQRFSVGGARIDIDPAVAPLEEVHAWARTFGSDEQILWSEDAVKLWDKFFHETVEVDQKNSVNSPLVARLDLTMKKLILLFAANRREKTVSEQSVIDAIHCYPYLKASYGISGLQVGPRANEIYDAVKEKVHQNYLAKKKGMSFSEIRRTFWRRNWDDDELDKVIKRLIAYREIEPEPTRKGTVGKPTVRYIPSKTSLEMS